MTEPTTAAGRALLIDLVEHVEALAPKESKPMHDATAKAILAIEAEARQQDGSALRAALEPIDDAVQYAIAFMNDPEGLAASREQWRDQLRTALHDLRALAALPPSAPATDCNDPEHPSGAYCRNTTGLPACYVPPSAPPALDEKGGCYFCGATGIASHAGCRGGNIPLPGDEDIERWFAAFAKVSGLDAKRLPGKRVIWGRFAAEYARLQEQDR